MKKPQATITVEVDLDGYGRAFRVYDSTTVVTKSPITGRRIRYTTAPYLQAEVEIVHAHACGIGRLRKRYTCNCGGAEMWEKWLKKQKVRRRR